MDTNPEVEKTDVSNIEMKQKEDAAVEDSSQTELMDVVKDTPVEVSLNLNENTVEILPWNNFIISTTLDVKETENPIEASPKLNENTEEPQSNILITSPTLDVKESTTKTENPIEAFPNVNENTAGVQSSILITPPTLDVKESTIKIENLIEASPNVNAVEIQSNILITAPKFDVKESVTKTENVKENGVSSVSTGLGLLAQYDSDNASEDENEPNTNSVIDLVETSNYRIPDVDIASDIESDSDSDTDSDIESLQHMRKVIDKKFGADMSDDDDVHEGSAGDKARSRQPPKVKGELLLDDLPPIQDLHITVPEEECIQLGSVHSIVDQLVLVNVLPNSVLLDLGTVLFLEKGQKVLGEVFDVLGQISDPLYCVRFNSNNQIKEKGISVGHIVYVAPKTEYTQFVILSNLMKVRGSDASWENDTEPPPRYLDYSDDEEEREARTSNRNRDRSTSEDPTKRSRPNLSSDRPEPSSSQQHQYTNRPQYSNSRGSSHRSFQPNNHNSNSWHSNFYQPYGGFPPSNYYIPPPPPPHANPMYFPHGQFNPYIQSMPPPPLQFQQNPMFNLNQYAGHPPALPPHAGPPQEAPPQQAPPGPK